MKRTITHIIYSITVFVVAAIATAGCADKGLRQHAAEGFLRIEGLGITVDEDIDPLAMTRTGQHQLEVVITDQSGNEVEHYASHLNMPLTTPLKAGNYNITTRSADRLTGARFDMPQYEASKQFTIEPARIETVNLLCMQTTSSVVVGYSELFVQTFGADEYRYHTVLSSSLGDQIRIESTETRAAYFKVPTPDVSIFCQVFMERKNISGGWDKIWGSATDGLKEMVFAVNTQEEAIKPAARYDVMVKI